MKKLHFLAFFSASLMTLSAAVLAACSSDDSTGGGGTDSGTDSPGSDSSKDNNVPTDGGSDAPEETAPPFDAGLTPTNFDDKLGAAVCHALARCCYGSATLGQDAGVDGGTYDKAKCEDFYAGLGFESSNVGREVADKGNVGIDQVKGADCLQKVEALPCPATTAAALQAARASCFGAWVGKLAANASCRSSIECGPNLFCKDDSSVDAGGDAGFIGKCTALRTTDQPCGDFTDNSDRGEEACSYRVSGQPPLYCNYIDFAGPSIKDAGDWTCQPTVANSSDCANSNWCTNGICDSADLKCKAQIDYFAPACSRFVH